MSTSCDGCVNLDQDANNGLDEVIEALEEVYPSDQMSRADFWALAGIVVLEQGATNGGTDLPEIIFRTGRVDCAESPYDLQEFEYPEGNMDHDTMFSYMESHFGYTANQTVALMGAHAIGNFHNSVSSYIGTFTTGAPKDLNNRFYSDMFDSTWTELKVKDDTI